MSPRAGLVLLCSALLAGAVSVTAAPAASAADAPSCSSFGTDVEHLIKPSSQANLLSRWPSETKQAAEQYGFTQDEGVLAQVASGSGAGLSPVWRLYKSGDFVWATGGDVDELKGEGYAAQFVDFYAASATTDCLNPVYRFKRGSVHRMATEKDSAGLVAKGWTRERVAFYAKTSDPTPVPPPAPDGGSTFSLAVLPDTQNESNSSTDVRFKNRAEWLAAHKSSEDLRYAMQIGDIVNWGNVVPEQFTKISNDIQPLEAAMPWAGAIGNHDTAAVCIGGSACPGQDAHVTVRDTSAYNRTFPVSRFPNVKGTFEPGKIDNSYQTFSAAGDSWLVLSLELWPRTAAVDWAKQVVASHPHDNVIVITHSYLEADGSISGSNGGYGANSPRYLFDNLIKVYPNIKMVFSGHVGDGAVRTDTGVNGNKILSMLQAFHSSTNPVRLVHIDTTKGTVTSEVYAPLAQAYWPQYASSTDGMSFVR